MGVAKGYVMDNIEEVGRILITDDDVYARDILETNLRGLGYEPIVAEDGPTALEKLAQSDVLIAIVDWHMPGMTGLELVRAIRQHDPTIQCIVLTGFGSMEIAVQALREHVYDYLAKPANLNDLSRVVSRAMEHARLLRNKQRSDAALARQSQELAESLKALHEAQDRLIRTANAALMGQLAEGLRHELGNALTVIRLNMSLIKYHREDLARFTRHVASMEQAVLSIERIALALRSFPTEQSNQDELVELASIVQQAARQTEQAHGDQAGLLHFDLEAPAYAFGSLFQLARAFAAIVENAVESSLAAHPDSPHVSIALHADGDSWRIAVADNGAGFTQEALEHAFEPGFTTKVERGFMRGLGLGLFVAGSVLDRHNGHIQLSNRAEGGALVEIWLPRAAMATDGEAQ
jgi:signal transduction histidine kinase